MTENGVVRIMANPAYSRSVRFTPNELIGQLRTFTAQTNHEFWPDDVSLLDTKVFASDRIHGSKQISDLYLLAVAAKHGARLATFDETIAVSAVMSANQTHLCAV
jgi:predicted nucleic acid-binding protein